MPKFLYSIIIFSITIVGFIIYFVFNKDPEEFKNIGIFLFLMFLLFNNVFSLILFAKQKKSELSEKDKKKLFQQSYKKSLTFSFYFVALGILKYLNLLNLLTAGLFTLTYFFGVYFVVRSFK